MSDDSPPPGGCGIKTASYTGGLDPPAKAILSGGGFKNGCRPEDVESRNIYREGEDKSPPGPGPSGRPASVIYNSTGIQCEALLAHGSILPGYVEVRIRCSDGRSWSAWHQVSKKS